MKYLLKFCVPLVQFTFLVSKMTTSVTFPLDMCPELYEVALTECNEDPNSKKENITAIIQWINKTPHLKARANDRLILAFLRRSKFSLEEAKRRMDAYYSFKNLFPEVLSERCVSEPLLEVMQTGIHIIPHEPISPSGSRLIISRFSKCDPKKFLPRDIFKLFFMLLEILALEDNNATIVGITYIVDAREVTMEQMLQYDPFLLKKMWMLVEYGLPLKINGIHIINMRREGQSVFNFVTTFLPPKIPYKLMVHQKTEDLYEHLPRDVMTIEYGGHNGFAGEAVKTWTQKLKNYKEYFSLDENYGVNEKLRSGLNNSLNIKEELGCGCSGSFRKIEFD